MKDRKSKVVMVRLTESEHQELERHAAENYRHMTQEVRMIINAGLESLRKEGRLPGPGDAA